MPKVKVNDINIYYEIYGRGQPLVLIHGFSIDHLVWQGIVAKYAEKYQVITLDLRGSGQTDCPDIPYTVEMMADDVIGLCDVLELDNVHFMGSSMGGAILQTIALKYPQRVCTAVLSNTFTKLDIRYALFAKGRLAFFATQVPVRAIMEASLGWVFSSDFLNREGMVDFLIEMRLANPYPITEIGYRNQLHALLQFDSEKWVNRIQVPCLVIGSDQDAIISEPHMRHLSNLIPNAEYYCFRNVGHVPHVEQPELFNDVVEKFLRSSKVASGAA